MATNTQQFVVKAVTESRGRKFYNEVDEDSFHRVERRYGSFARSLTLPQTADAERIEATFDRGVLRIEVPKVEAAKPKKITIKASG